MLRTKEEKEICRAYSAKDEKGYVHCDECPYVIPREAIMCRANAHYDYKRKTWVYDSR